MRVLISSAGRRVGLLRCFRDSFRELGLAGGIVAVDASLDAPAPHFADSFSRVPRCDDPAFVTRMLDIARREQVDLIVPTIDPELGVYARSRRLFEHAGVAVCVSSPATVAICADKQKTNRWLRLHGFPVPRQQNLAAALDDPEGWQFPVIVKPRRGSGSLGVRRARSFEELRVAANGRPEDYVVEAIASGWEHTINAFVDKRGVCRAAVPHRRLEVRGGEVSKAVTVRHSGLMRLARGICESLPGARGPLSIQCFLEDDGSILVTEINARFGGGYPLAHRAGARFTDWLLEEVRGLSVRGSEEWTSDLTMLRYDQELFVEPISKPALAAAHAELEGSRWSSAVSSLRRAVGEAGR